LILIRRRYADDDAAGCIRHYPPPLYYAATIAIIDIFIPLASPFSCCRHYADIDADAARRGLPREFRHFA